MKKIKDLKPGDIFLDTFGCEIEVEKIEPIEWSGIPRTSPKVKAFFISNGKHMVMNYRADREVKIIERD